MRIPVLWIVALTAYGAPASIGQTTPSEPWTKTLASYHWSPDGSQISFCSARLWVLDGATGAKRIALAEDRVSPILEGEACRTVWHPNSKSVMLVGTHRAVLVDLANGVTRTLLTSKTKLQAVEFSPDGKWISYLTGGRLLIRSSGNGTVHEIANGAGTDWLYRNRFGMESGYWWAPDSSAIAYLQISGQPFPLPGDRLPIASVHIANLKSADHRIVRLPPGEAYLPQIVWTPDSRHLAIQRLSRNQMRLELILADRATGNARELFNEADPYWINIDTHGLRFLPGGKRFVWSSERTTGFRHVYLYETETGRMIAQLTHGDWSVTSIDAINSQALFFTSTQQSSLDRQLYRVDLAPIGDPVALTSRVGWHSSVFSPAGDRYLDLASSAAQLPTLSLGAIEIATGTQDTDLLPVEFSMVRTHDGWNLNTLLIRPPNFDPARKYPAIILAPAGPGAQTVRNAADSEEYLWAQSMARLGFVVFAADGRGSGGRGHLFEEPIHFRLGGMELPDQLDALAALRKLGFVDMKRLGIFGSHYAGMLALGAMMHSHGVYRAGLADSPITDWAAVDAFTAERYLGPKTGAAVSYNESSPNEFAKRLEGGLLVVSDPDSDQTHVNALRNELNETHKIEKQRARIELLSHSQLYERATQFFSDSLNH